MKDMLLKGNKGKYVFVNLSDLNSEIMPEPDYGYFSLIAAAFDKTSFTTYKAILDNYRLYFSGLIGSVFEEDERERRVLNERYGLIDGIRRTLNEVGKDFNLSRERIRQIENDALGRVRHPDNRLDAIFYNKNTDLGNGDHDSEIDYTNIFENLLKQEMRCREANNGNPSWLVFENIINSIRFKPVYDEQSLEDVDYIEVRVYVILKRNGVLTVRELLGTSENDIRQMRHTRGRAFRQIMRFKSVLNMKRYRMDDNSIFEDKEQTLITRTNLPASMRLELLRRGFLFVSDFIEFYDYTDASEKSDEGGYFINNNYHLLKELLPYSQPVLCIKMSKALQDEIIKKQFHSVNDLKQNRCLFDGKLLEELDQFLLEVDRAIQMI